MEPFHAMAVACTLVHCFAFREKGRNGEEPQNERSCKVQVGLRVEHQASGHDPEKGQGLGA